MNLVDLSKERGTQKWTKPEKAIGVTRTFIIPHTIVTLACTVYEDKLVWNLIKFSFGHVIERATRATGAMGMGIVWNQVSGGLGRATNA